MSTHTIPDNIRAKVERLYSGAERTRVINALEAGKTVYIKGLKLKGVKKEDKTEGAETPPSGKDVRPPGGKDDKDKGGK